MNSITQWPGPNDMLLMETPAPGTYYPVRTKETVGIFEQYQSELSQYSWIQSIGRLGSYKYIGIPEGIRDAIDATRNI